MEFVFVGRGGQGLAVAVELLARASCAEGLEAQAIPFFGAERRGAPVRSYLRLSQRRIVRRDPVRLANGVVLADCSSEVLAEAEGVVLKPGGFFLVNADRCEPRDTRLRLGGRTAAVRADSIAREEGLVVAGWPIVGTVMAGSFARLAGRPGLRSLLDALEAHIGDVTLLERSKRAVMRAYEEVEVVAG